MRGSDESLLPTTSMATNGAAAVNGKNGEGKGKRKRVLIVGAGAAG